MDSFLSQPTEHNHAPVPERVGAIQLTNQVKIRAQTSDEPTSTILHSALRTLPLSAASELPRTEMIMQTIRRQRATPSAASKEERLPEALRKTDRGEDFVLGMHQIQIQSNPNPILCLDLSGFDWVWIWI